MKKSLNGLDTSSTGQCTERVSDACQVRRRPYSGPIAEVRLVGRFSDSETPCSTETNSSEGSYEFP